VDGWEARFEAEGELRRWGKIEERGESFFYFIKIMGWEAQCFPTKKPNFRVSVGG
jgi:hypothetical protein